MKINELLTTGNGIFNAVFKPDFAAAYTTIFGDNDPEILDTFVSLTYGQRTVQYAVTPANYKSFLHGVIALHVNEWTRQAKALALEYDILQPTATTTTRDETTTAKETNGGTSVNASVPYQSNGFVDTDKTTTDGDTARDETHKTTETTTGLGVGKSFADEIKKEVRLRETEWKKSIIFAIVNEITLSIY